MNATILLLTILLGCSISTGVDERPVGCRTSESPSMPDAGQNWIRLLKPPPAPRLADEQLPQDGAQTLLVQRLDLRPGANRNRGRTVTTGVPIGSYHAAQFSVSSGQAAKSYAARKQLMNQALITSRETAGLAVRGGVGGRWGRW